MSWLSFGLALLGLAKGILGYLLRRNTADAATAKLVLEGLRAIDERVANAEAARTAAERDFDAHGLRDDDPHLRD
jgi:hypothetical protein